MTRITHIRITNSSTVWGLVSRLLHWLTAVLVAMMFGLGWYMEGLEIGAEKYRLYNLHKSIGVTVLVLTLLRLNWRLRSPGPTLPASMPGWERVAARASHIALYILLIGMPVVGVAHSWAANFPVIMFGWFSVPSMIQYNEPLKDFLNTLHFYCGWFLFGIVGIHVSAALKHHFIDRSDVLRRMIR